MPDLVRPLLPYDWGSQPHPKLQSLLSRERGKASNFKFCTYIHIGSIGKSKRGRTLSVRNYVSKIFRAPIYRGHRAVIIAIAQLSYFSEETPYLTR